MKKTTLVCNRIAALSVAALIAGPTGAWAAETACGQTPNPPTIPDNGATASEQDMEDASSELEEYSALFAEFNDCTVGEYNAAIGKFDTAFDAYQNKIDDMNAAAQAEADAAAEDD
jgi:hypothetical protein